MEINGRLASRGRPQWTARFHRIDMLLLFWYYVIRYICTSKFAFIGIEIKRTDADMPKKETARHGAGGKRGPRKVSRAGGDVVRPARKVKGRRRIKAAEQPGVFAGSKGRFGVGVAVTIEERLGDETEYDALCLGSFVAKPGNRPKSRLLAVSDEVRTAALLAGLSHPDRIRLARAMAIGACTHHALSEAVKLKTGPLYHHLRELERAGISRLVARNTYGLTAVGRLALLVATGLGAAILPKSPWKHKSKKIKRKN